MAGRSEDQGEAEFTAADFFESLWTAGKSIDGMLRGFNADFDRLDCFVNGKRLCKAEFASLLSLLSEPRAVASPAWCIFDPAVLTVTTPPVGTVTTPPVLTNITPPLLTNSTPPLLTDSTPASPTLISVPALLPHPISAVPGMPFAEPLLTPLASLASVKLVSPVVVPPCSKCHRLQCFCKRLSSHTSPAMDSKTAAASIVAPDRPFLTSPSPMLLRPNSLYFTGDLTALHLDDFDVLLMSLMSGSSFGFGFEYLQKRLGVGASALAADGTELGGSDTHLLALPSRRPKMILTLLQNKPVPDDSALQHTPLVSLGKHRSDVMPRKLCADISFVNDLQIMRIGDDFPHRVAVVRCVTSLHISQKMGLLPKENRLGSVGELPGTPTPGPALTASLERADTCLQTRCLVRWSRHTVPHPGASFFPTLLPSLTARHGPLPSVVQTI